VPTSLHVKWRRIGRKPSEGGGARVVQSGMISDRLRVFIPAGGEDGKELSGDVRLGPLERIGLEKAMTGGVKFKTRRNNRNGLGDSKCRKEKEMTLTHNCFVQ